ncbi:MAG TPA: hypothetical protein GX513_13320, partial [Firmicutes bacterium]|nr:hypothetical protein [Bacillota bacterium]
MSFDLAEFTGLPLRWDPDRLLFADGLPEVRPSLRPWEELRPVLKDPASCPQGTAYFMYRDICWPTDRPHLEAKELRYDITVIPPAQA